MKIASWNVNSLRVRLGHVLEWLEENPVDALALQEIKMMDDQFPVDAILEAGYYSAVAGQKTYNGVAWLTREPPADVLRDVPGLDDPQRRIVAVTIGTTRLMNVYVPNGEAVDSDKYRYKLEWLEHVTRHVKEELAAHEKFAIVGDFNIAPADSDVYKPERWKDKVLCSAPERDAYQQILDLGLTDTFRLFDQEPSTWSWWDYRFNGFKRNAGLRIDLILASDVLRDTCTASVVDPGPRGLERPSDHAPVVATFD